jgi:hypothetical protein
MEMLLKKEIGTAKGILRGNAFEISPFGEQPSQVARNSTLTRLRRVNVKILRYGDS